MKQMFAATMALALVSGCGGGDTKSGTVTIPDGSKVDYVVKDDGESADVEISSDGGKVNIQSGSKVDLPDGFSVYPGSEVVTSASMNGSDGAGTVVTMTTKDSLDKVIAYYTKQIEARGLKIEGTIKTGEMQMVNAKIGETGGISVIVQSTDGMTSVTVTEGTS